MKKIILFSLCLGVGSLLLAQSRWSFGGTLQGGYSGVSSETRNDYQDRQFGDSYSLNQEKRQPALGAGVWLAYRLGARWGVQLGVDYSWLSAFRSFESGHSTPEGAKASLNQETYSTRQQQLQIPLEVQYYFGNDQHQWRPFLAVGVQGNYLFSQSELTESYYGNAGQEPFRNSYENKVDFTSDWYAVSRTQLNYTVGFGLASDRISVSLRRTGALSPERESLDYGIIYCGTCCFGNFCPYPYGNFTNVNFLQQTSLRFQYRFF
jgi:hypothetical protein